MYRDDLERVADEIVNSEIMWRGISDGAHGYDEIDTDEVTVRSEVARLTRLYERAVRLNGMNNPDMYMAGAGGFDGNTSGGPRPSRGGPMPNITLPAAADQTAQQPTGDNPGAAAPLAPVPDDVAPATKAEVKDDKPKEEKKEETKSDGKKPATDGASDDKAKAADQSTSKPAAESSSAPGQAPPQPAPPQPAPPQAPAAAPVAAEDPDASPATAAHLKPKKLKSNGKQPEGSGDAKKVAGDEEE